LPDADAVALANADFDGFNDVKYPWAKTRKDRCVVNSVDATNEILDAGIAAWAAAERCTDLKDDTVHCIVDITAESHANCANNTSTSQRHRRHR